MSDILLWTPAKTYIHQLYASTEYHLEDLPKTIADKDRLWESQGNPQHQHTLIMMMMFNGGIQVVTRDEEE